MSSFTERNFILAHERILNEEHADTSSDSGSLASGRVPSISDCVSVFVLIE